MAIRSIDELPLVWFDEHVGFAIDASATTLRKLRRLGAFPIPELPQIDKRHRYARADVVAYLNGETRAQGSGRGTRSRR